MAIHERVWEKTESRRPAGPAEAPMPKVTWALLGSMVAVYLVELLLRESGRSNLLGWTFLIGPDWYLRPWTLITSTFAHDPRSIMHLLLNGMFLFFFGPIVERLVGGGRLALLFVAAGAVSGVAQVELAAALHENALALGASGALMMLFGILMVILPNEKLMLYFVIPVPFWAAGIGYAVLDLLGVFDPTSQVGHFAHLAGMAIGLGYGLWMKKDWRRRGVALVRG